MKKELSARIYVLDKNIDEMKTNLNFKKPIINPLRIKKKIYKSNPVLMRQAKEARLRYSKERKSRRQK
jgi:hypothetical protein